MPVNGPGSAFWTDVYGIPDYDVFKMLVGPYLPDVHWFGLGPSEETIALLAWEDPLSSPGEVAAIALSVQAVAGNGESGTHSAVRNYAPRAELGQESTMAQLIIPNCFQVNIDAFSGSQPVTNVIGVQNGGGTALGAANAVRTAWKIASGPLASLSNLYVLSQFRAMDIGSNNGAIAVVTDTSPGLVSVTNSLATNAASALVKWNGSTRSRSSRGRLYFGPLMEVNINPDGRTLTSSTVTNLGNAFDLFRNSLSSQGYPLVVLSRTLSQAFTVSGSAIETVIATQRRRIRS